MIMILRILMIMVAGLALAISGCKEKTPPPEPAQVEVTPENLDSELDKMEAQIEADLAAEE